LVQLLAFRRIITRPYVMGGTNAQLPAGWQMSLSGHRADARAVHSPTNRFSAQLMAIMEPEPYSSLWAACDAPE
jgi:hypothetical protein